jgi:hypothetical protein
VDGHKLWLPDELYGLLRQGLVPLQFMLQLFQDEAELAERFAAGRIGTEDRVAVILAPADRANS